MSSFTNSHETKVLDHVLGTTTLTKPTTVYAALFTVSPTDSTAGTEVTGGGYVRKPVTFGDAVAGSPSHAVSTAAVSWTAGTGGFGTVVAMALFDALTGGNMIMWDDSPADKSVAATDVYQFSSITVTLD